MLPVHRSFWEVSHARNVHDLACVEMWLLFSDKDELEVQYLMLLSPQALSADLAAPPAVKVGLESSPAAGQGA